MEEAHVRDRSGIELPDAALLQPGSPPAARRRVAQVRGRPLRCCRHLAQRPSIQARRAQLLAELGRLDEAVSLLKSLVEKEPESLVARYARTHAPFVADDLALRLAVPVTRITGALSAPRLDVAPW